ncbi:hypothetical protein BCR36DRAFT_56996 [Piromyces finnis]|uniref:Uncharacterized protein n=1 Tax=Piromyces finnis TaxID=1754191 RepID=A0A1Y1U6P5_9FUNG|nr:hypothetical protein BCR36DRAFT_56996 [Piromyces finnis]|eukprot:ORX33710.1 hypothetical protein BCR36DRAFT_56996 [Piromyces finnis]
MKRRIILVSIKILKVIILKEDMRKHLKKLNQIFTLQHNNKLNESRANSIKENSLINISSSVSSPIKSQNNPTSNVNNVNTNKTTNGQPINNNNYNNDYSNNKQIQFKEIKSNTDVMEKIFLNDDHENIEVKEKHFNDFNILKKLISDKEKNKNENSIIKEESNKQQKIIKLE